MFNLQLTGKSLGMASSAPSYVPSTSGVPNGLAPQSPHSAHVGGGYGGMSGGWLNAVSQVAKTAMIMKKAQRAALKSEAALFQRKIVEGMVTGAPGGKTLKPLSPFTVAMRTFGPRVFRRGGFARQLNHPLVEFGDLISNVTMISIDKDNIFVGIPRGRLNREGESLTMIGMIQEYGAGPKVIKMTPKMRALLAQAFRMAGIPPRQSHGTGQLVIKIPPRPFLAPVMEEYGKSDAVKARVEKAVTAHMLGVLG